MGDNCNKINKMSSKSLHRLFPYGNRKINFNQLKIDDDSIHYISTKDVADEITTIIDSHLRKLFIDPSEAVVTDATAGVGGNAISFGFQFKFVNAIELDSVRHSYLTNNVEVYGLKNFNVYKGNCLDILNTLQHNAIFFDPPWGGSDYKSLKSLDLFLSEKNINDIINWVMGDESFECHPELIIIKVPKNFNLREMYQHINSDSLYIYNLKKMDIIVIENINKINDMH